MMREVYVRYHFEGVHPDDADAQRIVCYAPPSSSDPCGAKASGTSLSRARGEYSNGSEGEQDPNRDVQPEEGEKNGRGGIVSVVAAVRGK